MEFTGGSGFRFLSGGLPSLFPAPRCELPDPGSGMDRDPVNDVPQVFERIYPEPFTAHNQGIEY